MKKAIAMIVMIGVTVAVMSGMTARAAILPGDELKLTLDQAGNATLTNVTGATLAVDFIEISSAGGNLDPLGWYSIADAVSADIITVLFELGPGALSFGELAALPSVLAEVSLSGFAAFQPAAPWAYGKPVLGTPSVGDLNLYYHTPTSGGDKYLGIVEILSDDEPIPEPAGLGLIGVALLAVRRRRR